MLDDKTLAALGDRDAQDRITKRGELLPCPFCGCEGVMRGEGTHVKWIQCERCLSETGTEDTEEDAIYEWNTRAPILTPEQIKRLEEMQ